MNWYLDSHKFMSEITRKALQIIVAHNINSESTPEEIKEAEKELVSAGVYQGYNVEGNPGAKGRIRRALLTYFKAYDCMEENGLLTETGRLFAENKLSLQEFDLHFLLNYHYTNEDGADYYPIKLLLLYLKKLEDNGVGTPSISAYEFSKITNCDSYEDLSDSFMDEMIEYRNGEPIEVNERGCGFDVWRNLLINSCLFYQASDKTLVVKNKGLANWILAAYEQPIHRKKGVICSGVFAHLPIPTLHSQGGDADEFISEGRALQAYLFTKGITNNEISRYIFTGPETRFQEMIKILGLTECRGFYKCFAGLENLVGYCLLGSTDNNIKVIGSILVSVKPERAVIAKDSCVDYDTVARLKCGINTLLYGVPGSGKSWTIEHEYRKKDSVVERVVFHPDYTNADFLGQILPVVNNNNQVTYEFTPGPFTTILRSAYVNPMEEHILIIEEINRGNAPAIFGEVFQLLDRKVNDDGFPFGTSEYGITHSYMANYIYGDPSHEVRIPSNLSILGTMNTSDQNVFTLDTAFQRRWNMRLIENTFDNVRASLTNALILDTTVTWKKFCETINMLIVKNRTRMASAEDKRLGVYFAHEKELEFDNRALPSDGYADLNQEYNSLLNVEQLGGMTSDQKKRLDGIREALKQNRRFPEKIIKFLWDDAFKFNPGDLFDTTENKMDSLEKVIHTFVFSVGKNRFDIFKRTVRESLFE